MNLIKLNKSLCDNCFKCLRVCPTKAIEFSNNERSIIENKCIKCGLCHSKCSQHALELVDGFSDIRRAIKSDIKTVVSLAPSYLAVYDTDNPDSIAAALRKLGFDHVEETAVGAGIVYERYSELIGECDTNNLITTCCPSATYLVESHFPELIDNMMKVVSPMTAHGFDIKRRYGEDAFVIFIGPCLAKIAEAGEYENAVDGVMTFAQFSKWLSDSGIDLNETEPEPFDLYGGPVGRMFPLGHRLDESRYRYLQVNGIKDCKEILRDMKEGIVSDTCVELNICDGGCINGPELPEDIKGSKFTKKSRMLESIGKKARPELTVKSYDSRLDLDREFKRREFKVEEPTAKQLDEILRKMRKYSENEQLNCGACGYETCIEKATAVFNGYSSPTDCLPYLREIAEEDHSQLIRHSPNGICIIDNDNVVMQTNPKFENLFNRNNGISSIGLPIGFLVDNTLLKTQIESNVESFTLKIYEEKIDRHFLVNLVYDSKRQRKLVFFADISIHEKSRIELEEMKKETLKKTNEIIDRQMRVVQEIAGLLGETTAETRVSLNELKDLIIREQ